MAIWLYMRIDDSTDRGGRGRERRYQRWQDIQNKIYDRRASVQKRRRNSNNKMKSTLRNKRNDNVAKWSYLAQQKQRSLSKQRGILGEGEGAKFF